MGVLPGSRAQMIAWFSQRITIWSANAAALGLDMAHITDLATKLDAAETKLDEANTIRAQSEGVTFEYHVNADDLKSFGADLIKVIKAKAEADGDPSLYALAQIPPPSAPTPLGPPAQPTNLTSTLGTLGEIDLRWKGSRKGGTSFSIHRAVTIPGQATGSFTLIGTSEEARFVDDNIPVGLANATYYIVAHRSGGSSAASDPTIVYFGSGSGSQQAGGDLSLAA